MRAIHSFRMATAPTEPTERTPLCGLRGRSLRALSLIFLPGRARERESEGGVQLDLRPTFHAEPLKRLAPQLVGLVLPDPADVAIVAEAVVVQDVRGQEDVEGPLVVRLLLAPEQPAQQRDVGQHRDA